MFREYMNTVRRQILHRDYESKERRVKDLFLAFNVAHELVDGANKGIKERRDELFGISGVRGSYPQIFVVGIWKGQKVQEC